MTQLLMFRERGIRFFKEYETWFRIGGKFIGMMFVFICVNSQLGYFAPLNSLPVVVLLSLICSIIPSGFVVFIVGAVAAAHMMSLSSVIGITAIIVMLIIYLLFLKYSSGQTLVLLAVPVLMQWNLHFMVPVIAGLLFTPYAFIPAAAGMFLAKFLGYCSASASLAGTGDTIDYEGILTALNNIFTQSLTDRSLWLFIIVAAVAITAGYITGRMSFDYSWYIALIVSAVFEIAAAFIISAVSSTITVDAPALIIGAVLGVIVGAVIQFFRCVVNYAGKQYVQFEDEEYYYYVKAVPKYLEDSEPDEKENQ